jgi:hypothetical protein
MYFGGDRSVPAQPNLQYDPVGALWRAGIPPQKTAHTGSWTRLLSDEAENRSELAYKGMRPLERCEVPAAVVLQYLAPKFC